MTTTFTSTSASQTSDSADRSALLAQSIVQMFADGPLTALELAADCGAARIRPTLSFVAGEPAAMTGVYGRDHIEIIDVGFDPASEDFRRMVLAGCVLVHARALANGASWLIDAVDTDQVVAIVEAKVGLPLEPSNEERPWWVSVLEDARLTMIERAEGDRELARTWTAQGVPGTFVAPVDRLPDPSAWRALMERVATGAIVGCA